MLIELQPFDLDGGRLIPWDNLVDQVDPILAFWETHDVPEVRAHLFTPFFTTKMFSPEPSLIRPSLSSAMPSA